MEPSLKIANMTVAIVGKYLRAGGYKWSACDRGAFYPARPVQRTSRRRG
jgi:hypothetical protein